MCKGTKPMLDMKQKPLCTEPMVPSDSNTFSTKPLMQIDGFAGASEFAEFCPIPHLLKREKRGVERGSAG